MAKKLKALVKLQIPAGKANPAPPVGTALGPHGVNIMGFCKEYNARTQQLAGQIIPAEISVFTDGSFTFITKTPPAPDLIKSHVTAISSLGDQPFDEKLGGHHWEMTVAISTEVFIHQKDLDLKGLVANANFYKCADDAAQKHYLSWNPIKTERPNFHQPQFFGTVVFE